MEKMVKMEEELAKSLGRVGERKLTQSKRVSKLKEQGFQTSNNVVRSLEK